DMEASSDIEQNPAVSVAEKERQFLPVRVTPGVTKGGDDVGTEPTAPMPTPAPTVLVPPGTVTLIDVKLQAGKHTIAVKAQSYKDWSHDVTVGPGSDVQ